MGNNRKNPLKKKVKQVFLIGLKNVKDYKVK